MRRRATGTVVLAAGLLLLVTAVGAAQERDFGPKVSPSRLRAHIRLAFPRPRQTIHVWGPPGIGKSQIFEQVAHEVRGGIDKRDPLVVLLLSQRTEAEVRGVPWAPPRQWKAAPPGSTEFERQKSELVFHWLRDGTLPDPTDRGQGIVLADELNHALPAVRAAAYQLLNDRRLGDYLLPDGWLMASAANRPSDRGVGYGELELPLANRLQHFELVSTLSDWLQWARGADIHPIILGLHHSTGGKHLNRFDKVIEAEDEGHARQMIFPTPRSWEKASHRLFALLEARDAEGRVAGVPADEMIFEQMHSLVGLEAALALRVYAEVHQKLPRIEDVLSGAAKMPHEVIAQFLLAEGLVARAKAAKDDDRLASPEKRDLSDQPMTVAQATWDAVLRAATRFSNPEMSAVVHQGINEIVGDGKDAMLRLMNLQSYADLEQRTLEAQVEAGGEE